MPGKKRPTPDIVVGIDFGMTSTAVAFSYAPAWERPDNIQQWEGLSVADSQNKVPSALVYTPGGKTLWGFGCDYETAIPKDDFKLELDPAYAPNDPERIPVHEARKWYLDYMTLLHDFLARRFDDLLPRWRDKIVEWHFSVPTTWTSHRMKLELQELLGNCGFGSDGLHHSWSISLTEAEAAAVHAGSQPYQKGDIIMVCDAGGGTTDVNILRLDSNLGEPIRLTPLDHDEGRDIGSTNIDDAFRQMAEKKLRKIASHLTQPPDKVARKMVRSHGARFQSAKCGFYDGAVAQQPTIPIAIPDLANPAKTNFPELGIRNGKLFLELEELKSYFDNEIDGIISLINERLVSLYARYPTVQVTWLVRTGGLGSSPYVDERLKQHFDYNNGAPTPNASGMRIVWGKDPLTAISRGLVVARVQELKHMQDVFALRCAQASYGIVIKRRFNAKRHFGEEVKYDPVLKQNFAVGQIDWIVTRGKPIDSDKQQKKYTMTTDKAGVADVLTARIVTTTADPARLPPSRSKAAKDRVRLEDACSISVTMPAQHVERKRRHFFAKSSYRECTFYIRIVPEVAEIRFKLLTKDGEECATNDGTVEVEWGALDGRVDPTPDSSYEPILEE